MKEKLRILLLEDSADDAALILHMLKKAEIAFTAMEVESQSEYVNGLSDFLPDVVISDHTLPQFNSVEALKLFREYKERQNPMAVFILVTGTVSEEFAVSIMKTGADDYILKDRLTRLPAAINSALEKRRLQEEKRKAEEEKLHLLEILQKTLNEIFIFSSDTLKFKYVNEEAIRNLGYSLEELGELTPFDLIREAETERLEQVLAEVEENKKSRILERYMTRKDGSRYPVQIHLQLIEEHGGKRTFLANVLDVTEIKIQEVQKELAYFVQETFNQNMDLQVCLERVLEGICKRKNLSAAEIFAFSIDGSQLKRFAFYDPKDGGMGEIGLFMAQQAYNAQKPLCHPLLQELDLPEDHGKEKRFASAQVIPLGLGDETIAVINLYSEKPLNGPDEFTHLGEGLRNQLANNIERKRTEGELAQIFENTPQVLTLASVDGYFKKINPFFARLLGYTVEELLSIPFRELIHPDDQWVLTEWESTIDVQQILNYQVRYKTRSGEYRWLAWSIVPFVEGGLSFAAAMDITEERKYLKAIEDKNKRLAEIAWEQSHVVRAPLVRLLGCVNHLEDSQEDQEKLMQSIKASAHELDEIVKAIVKKSEFIRKP